MRVSFANFRFDSEARALFRDETPIHLTPKAIALLEALLARRPNAVSKKELFDAVWPDVIVEDGNLKNVVSELREALADGGRRRQIIRTVHGYGYAFIGVINEEEPAPDLPGPLVGVTYDARQIVLPPGPHLLGRASDCRVVIDLASVSRHHACVRVKADVVTIEDLASKNGTFVCGTRVEGVVDLRDGDEIQLGSVKLTVWMRRREGTTQTL